MYPIYLTVYGIDFTPRQNEAHLTLAYDMGLLESAYSGDANPPVYAGVYYKSIPGFQLRYDNITYPKQAKLNADWKKYKVKLIKKLTFAMKSENLNTKEMVLLKKVISELNKRPKKLLLYSTS
jgi:hypothetical protein